MFYNYDNNMIYSQRISALTGFMEGVIKMIIWLVLMLIAPGMFAMLFYEYITGKKNGPVGQIIISVCFMFFINMLTLTAVWLRGNERIIWTADAASVISSVSFSIRYMALAVFFAFLLPWVVALFHSLMKIKWVRAILMMGERDE
jgi:hypothetical protein